MKRKQHGGKREGAGRPPVNPEPTVPIRVPKSLASWIKGNLDKIRHLKDSE